MSTSSRVRTRATVGWRGRIRTRLGRGRSEGGSVLVEAAFVFPVFMLLLFGMIEFGFIFKDSLTLSTMVEAGARTGSEVGNESGGSASSPSADYAILSAMQTEASSLNAKIIEVVIFNANPTSVGGNPLTQPPSLCVGTAAVPGASQANECNVYSGSDLTNLAPTWADETTANFGCNQTAGPDTGGSGCLDSNWQPAERVVSEDGNNGAGPDYLGVYISAQHTNLTGFFPSVTLHETTVMRLEPQSFS